MSLLEIEHLTHRYRTTGARPVLSDVNMTLEAGRVLAVVGESGCGKSTLGKLIAGLAKPTSGRVLFDGRDIRTLHGADFKAWRRSVQLVHQDPYSSLNPGLAIRSALGPALVHHKLATRRDVDERLRAILAQVGLDATPDFLRRFPHQLSGGQRQRVAIARAVSLQPRLIVADEVTSMLDVSMRVAILDLLLSFRADHGITYVFISHDFGVVRYFAQGGRVLVMFYGVLVEDATAEELISQPQHPYTYLLLQAIPVPDPVLAQRQPDEQLLDELKGDPSDEGCVFSNRCPFAEARCHAERPPLAEVQPGRRTACFFPERVPPVSRLTTRGASNAERVSTSFHANGSSPADNGGRDPLRRPVGG